MAITITAIEKKGPVIICTTDDPKGRAYRMDFKEGKVYGLTGKPLQSTSTILNKISFALKVEQKALCAALDVFSFSSNASLVYYSVIESMLSYPELLLSSIDGLMVKYIIDNCDGKLPKGYVTWLKLHNFKFSYPTLDTYYRQHMLDQWPSSLRETVKKVSDGMRVDLAGGTDYDRELCASLVRIINNSLKRYEINGIVNQLENIMGILRNNPSLRQYLDDTKNATAALQILNDIVNQERNQKILANEARIAALNGKVIGDLMIKVPSAMGEFTDEGEQQHNCVGYYHHDRMARGDTLIYFLRHVCSPERSYVTCRFNTNTMVTAEHRTRNNAWFDDPDNVFPQIDNMIRALLK